MARSLSRLKLNVNGWDCILRRRYPVVLAHLSPHLSPVLAAYLFRHLSMNFFIFLSCDYANRWGICQLIPPWDKVISAAFFSSLIWYIALIFSPGNTILVYFNPTFYRLSSTTLSSKLIKLFCCSRRTSAYTCSCPIDSLQRSSFDRKWHCRARSQPDIER